MANNLLLKKIFSNVQLFLDILDNTDVGVYIVDTDRTILFWSKGAEKLTAIPKDIIVGKHCFESSLNHEDLKGNKLCIGFCPLVGSMYDGKVRNATVCACVKNENRYFDVSTYPIFDDGSIIGAYEIFRLKEGDIYEKE